MALPLTNIQMGFSQERQVAWALCWRELSVSV